MRKVRLPSGPLACVYAVGVDSADGERGYQSGVFRAFSGSVEAEGVTEAEALAELDQRVRRLSVPPPPAVTEWELSREAPDHDDVTRVETLREAQPVDGAGYYSLYERPSSQAPASS